MLAKCANPKCSARLRYFRGGRIFRLGRDRAADLRIEENDVSSSAVEYFWLCPACCRSLTLSYDPYRGVVAVDTAPQWSKSRQREVPAPFLGGLVG